MGVVVLEPPAVEPVSTAEAKLFLRIDHDAEDEAIAGFVRAARTLVEDWTGRALVTRRVRETRDAWSARGDGAARLALAPAPAVHALRVADAAGAMATVVSGFRLDIADGVMWMRNPPAPGVPVAGIEIEYDAGYGAAADDVPAPLRHAVLLLVATLYEGRDGEGPSMTAARVLVQPYRRVRL